MEGIPTRVTPVAENRDPSAGSSATADRPRTRLGEDELGYREFAEAVAAALASRAGDEGIVIAIHGRWGTGKTSAVNMALDALECIEASLPEDRRTIVARFNPWWFSEQKDLTRAFFSEINASIGRRLSQGVRDGFRKVAKRVTGASDLVSAMLAWTPAGPAAKQIAEIVKGAGEEIQEERSLESVRDDLAHALRAESRNIVVVIDDVDRLMPEEVRQIFRLVKSVADLPRVTYLLVFDRDIAERALEAPSDPDGPHWLEKIVQASFDLPPAAQADLNRLFLNRLGAIIGAEPIMDPVRWGNLFHGAVAPWLRTARDVGRLANAVAMTWPSVKGEVDVGDFVAIQTMRLFEPALFSFVRSHPDDLTGSEPQSGYRDHRDAFGQALLANVPEARHARVKRAMCFVFPRLDAVFGNTWRGGDWRRDERDRLVSSRRRFPVYFTLGLGDGIVSADEIEAFRASFGVPTATRAIVERYSETARRAGGSRAGVLLSTLMAQVDEVPPEAAEPAARAMLAAADLFLNPLDGSRTPDGFPVQWAVSFVINPLLSKVDPDVRAALLIEAVEGPSPILASYLVTSMSVEHARAGEKEAKPEAERSLPLEAVVELERLMAARIARDAASGALTRSADAAGMIWAWARIAGTELVREWISSRLEEPGFARWLMVTFTGTGTTQVFGDMVGQRIHTVDRMALSKLMDVDALAASARVMIEKGADEGGVAAHFLEGLQTRF